MKAMQKTKRGTGFGGLLRYLFANEQHRFLGGNMISRDIRNLSREFGATRQLRQDIEKPVWHQALRLQKDERISDEKWLQILDEYMTEMGFDPEMHMRSYIMHDDPDGQHVHIIASRISIDSQLYLGRNENLRSTKIVEKLEKKYGLKPSPKAEPKPPAPPNPDPTPRERASAAIQAALDAVTQARLDAIDFILELEKRGISARPNIAKTGRMSGFSFEYKNEKFQASKLDRKYVWSRLKESVLFDADAHTEPLRAYADSLDTTHLKEIKNNDRARAIAEQITAATERNSSIRAQSQRELAQHQQQHARAVTAATAALREQSTRLATTRAAATETTSRAARIKQRYKQITSAAKQLYTNAANLVNQALERFKRPAAPIASPSTSGSPAAAFAAMIKEKQTQPPQQIDLVHLLDRYIKNGLPINTDDYDSDTYLFMRDLINYYQLEQPSDSDLHELVDRDIHALDTLINNVDQSQHRPSTPSG